MRYYVKNQSGGVSGVSKRLFEKLQKNPDYECWTEDPYADIPEEVQAISYPKPKGAGWYELSNGKSVRGEQKAIEAQKALNDG